MLCLIPVLGYLLFQPQWLLTAMAVIKHWLSALGPAAPVLFVLLGAALIALGFPRLLLCSIAGMFFGFATGMVWSTVATLAGSYLTFSLVRRGGAGLRLKWPKLAAFAGRIQAGGVGSVLLIRQLPLSGFYNNALLGLSAVGVWDFLIGSGIGFMPGAVPSVMLGAGLLQDSSARMVEMSLAAAVSFIVLGLALKWWLASRSRLTVNALPKTLLSDFDG